MEPVREIPEPRRVAILIYPGVQSLDVTGPLEVFTGADSAISHLARDEGVRQEGRRAAPGYEVTIVGRDAPTSTSSGLAIAPGCSLEGVPAELDTLIVPGGSGHRRAADDEELVAWIARTAPTARRTVSVCTGAFLLARAGLLDGRRATTHWAFAQELAEAHPEVEVDPDPIYIRDRDDLDLGRSDRRDGPGAGAGRGGPRPRAGPHDRPPPGPVPAPSGKPVAVQRDAQLPGARARAAEGDPAVRDRGSRR